VEMDERCGICPPAHALVTIPHVQQNSIALFPHHHLCSTSIPLGLHLNIHLYIDRPLRRHSSRLVVGHSPMPLNPPSFTTYGRPHSLAVLTYNDLCQEPIILSFYINRSLISLNFHQNISSGKSISLLQFPRSDTTFRHCW